MITATIFRLFCSIAGSEPAYFAAFDSGDHDQEACQMVGGLLQAYFSYKTDKPAQCACRPVTLAHI